MNISSSHLLRSTNWKAKDSSVSTATECPEEEDFCSIPSESTDIDFQEELASLQEKAESLHTTGDALGMFTLFGMPLYAPVAFAAANLLGKPDLAMPFALVATGGIVGASVLVTQKGNELRAQAEALNDKHQRQPELQWTWS